MFGGFSADGWISVVIDFEWWRLFVQVTLWISSLDVTLDSIASGPDLGNKREGVETLGISTYVQASTY